jgi:hypothetical protein
MTDLPCATSQIERISKLVFLDFVITACLLERCGAHAVLLNALVYVSADICHARYVILVRFQLVRMPCKVNIQSRDEEASGCLRHQVEEPSIRSSDYAFRIGCRIYVRMIPRNTMREHHFVVRAAKVARSGPSESVHFLHK